MKMHLHLALVLLLSSCGNYFEQNSEDPEDAPVLFQDTPDFAEIRTLIFEPKCVSCHSQYQSYQGVRRELESILSAVTSDRMPKASSPLTQTAKARLRQWIELGAPEVKGEISSPPEPILAPDWTSISQNILGPRCVVCHSPNGQAKFLDLSTRLSIFSERKRLFNFEDPEASYLIEVIADDLEPMPPPDSNIRRLNQNEVDVLIEWIRLGLP